MKCMMCVLDVATPNQIAGRAWEMFGPTYIQIAALKMKHGGYLPPSLHACLIDMECMAENALIREYQERNVHDEASGSTGQAGSVGLLGLVGVGGSDADVPA